MAEEKKTVRGSSKGRRRHRRSNLSRLAGALLYVVIVIGISAVLATVGWNWANDVLALDKEDISVVVTLPESIFTEETVEVEKKNADGTVTLSEKEVKLADMDHVADLLEENGLIEYKFLFKLFAKITGGDTELSAGAYELNSDMDYNALLTNLGRNSATKQVVTVTIPEGYTIDQTFALLEEKGVASAEELREMAATHDYKFEWLMELELPLGDYRRLEGFLFPDTYEFYVGHDPLYAINKMLLAFNNKIKPYLDEIREDEDYDLHDIVTIASLIEKETDGTDQTTIASVIYNRLENTSASTAGFLQIDATLAYINGGKVPTDADKQIDSPYNTYLHKGLPAGPIANPGMQALYAALNPENTKYYYYVLNPETKRHEFKQTYEGHMSLVEKYYG